MTQMKNKLFMVALVLVGILITSCSEEDNITDFIAPQRTVTLTTTIDLDVATTRALTEGGIKTFAEGEKVAVIYTNTSSEKAIAEYTLQAADISADSKSTKLNFTLTDPKDGNSDVTIVYPASLADKSAADGISMTALQSKQDGTFDKLSSDFDAATATNQMTVASGTATLPEVIALTNPLTIGKFTIKESEGGTDITNTITSFTVSDGTNTYMVNRTVSADPIYVAMKPIASSATINVSATDGTYGYEKAVTGKSLDANKIYPVNVTMTKTFEGRATPLTLEAMTAGKISFQNFAAGPVKYKVNGGEAQTIVSGQYAKIYVNAGDKVSFYGKNEKYYTNTYSNIHSDYGCYVYGNIMSLVSGLDNDGNISTAFTTAVTLTEANTFYYLFAGNVSMKNHSVKSIVLPATTLAERCYSSMFYGCTGLTTAPVLPATTLAAYCYSFMFSGCTGLTTAPELPATTLAEYCYSAMFDNCTGLTTARELPATTLAGCCYDNMFYGCTNLTTAPTLPATTLASSCYHNMFYGCTNLTTAPTLPATTLAAYCYLEMFRGCTGLTTAPTLPAPTLVPGCYNNMFNGCSNLSSVTCLATTNIDDYNCSNWLNGVATNGTFTKAAGATWPTGVSGIPSGWTVQNPQNMPLTFEAKVANSNVKLTLSSHAIVNSIEYSTDGGGSWQPYTSATDITLANVGDKVQFRGTATTYNSSKFSSNSGELYAYGNVMSLLYGSDFANKTAFPSGSTNTFGLLFYDFDNLYNHPELTFALPATTLAESCYYYMFSNCRNLTTAPLLPATTLAIGCYYYMFAGCINLSSVTCLATANISSSCLNFWLYQAGTNATSPTLHVKSTMASANWNAPGWTIVGDQ